MAVAIDDTHQAEELGRLKVCRWTSSIVIRVVSGRAKRVVSRHDELASAARSKVVHYTREVGC